MKLPNLILVLILIVTHCLVLAQPRHFPPGSQDITISDRMGVRGSLLRHIAPIVNHSIDQGLYPGAVILAAHRGQIIYRGVFGNRRLYPDVAPMKFDTIFDVASLTKVVVTTTAIMQLIEQGKLDLDAPVASYWPEFSHNGKQAITVRELLTHTSGLPAGLTFPNFYHPLPGTVPSEFPIHGTLAALKGVEQERLLYQPGSAFKYSDVNFIALGHLVEIISGQRLDDYARKNIFKPLGMSNTSFRPSTVSKDNIAPTQILQGRLRWGEVHDDTAYLMGGVSGMAGIFSNASDLGTFAEVLVNGGRIPSYGFKSKYLLGPLTIMKMTSPQTPPNLSDVHGLGWDLDSRYSNRGILFPVQSYGHTGWTGTSIWIDKITQTWLIILTSRTHPTPATINPLIHDRKAIANIIAASITDIPNNKIKNTGKGELIRAFYKD